MKKYLLILFMLVFIFETSAQTSLYVISDPHVLSPEYIAQCDNKKSSEMLVPLSPDILTAAIDSVIAKHAEGDNTYFLIVGDMSLNGEENSHRYVAEQLERLKKVGISPLVIPGNHDLYNTWACHAKNDNGMIAKQTKRETFLQIYNQCGYLDAYAVKGLSYVKKIDSKFALICLDDALDDKGKTYFSDGALDKNTLEWAKQQAITLRDEGCTVLVAVHHHVIAHHKHEETLVSSRMLNATAGRNYGISNDEVLQTFADAGIKYILTGHYHAHDIQQKQVINTSGQAHIITEIATGSLAAGGNYMRTLKLSAQNGSIEITSTKINISRDEAKLRQFGVTDWYPNQTFREYSDSCFREGNDRLAFSQLKQQLGSFAELARGFVEPLSVAFDCFYMGDDKAGNEIPFEEDDKWMLDALRIAKPKIYELLDSMCRNYADDPKNVTPDLNLSLGK